MPVAISLGGCGIAVLLWVLGELKVHPPKVVLYLLLVVAVMLIVGPWIILRVRRGRHRPNALGVAAASSGAAFALPRAEGGHPAEPPPDGSRGGTGGSGSIGGGAGGSAPPGSGSGGGQGGGGYKSTIHPDGSLTFEPVEGGLAATAAEGRVDRAVATCRQRRPTLRRITNREGSRLTRLSRHLRPRCACTRGGETG
jgi:hypothetical protein